MAGKARVVFRLSTGRGAIPVKQAKVTVTEENEKVIATVYTNDVGKTEVLMLDAPSKELAGTPFAATIPYSICHASIEAEGFIPIQVRGIQLFDEMLSIEQIQMVPLPISKGSKVNVYDIPEHILRQDDGKRMEYSSVGRENRKGRSYVHIPTHITVHLGKPEDSAVNMTVSFLDYIKNVASSELYPTWPQAALEANIYAQITFTLHRLYTGWYSENGYDFDITNQVEYDQAFTPGRNIYSRISQIVDRVLAWYIRQMDKEGPYFTNYGNGGKSMCTGLSKWGTVSLAEQGYAPSEILQYYYGEQMELMEANLVEPVNSPFPGFVLERGSISPSVETIEKKLNCIHRYFAPIPMIIDVDYRFTSETERAVLEFQKVFELERTGKVNEGTWNRIACVNTAILKLYEMDHDGEMQPIPCNPPTILLRFGSRGIYVRLVQYFIKVISCFYEEIRTVDIDGIFGKGTAAAVLDVQHHFDLGPDGIVGPLTWDQLYNVYLGIATTIGIIIPYPGYLVRRGIRGDNVYLMQEYLKLISTRVNIPDLDLDGIFGPGTEASVMAFQELFGLDVDGIIGKNTWDRIVDVRRMI